MSSVKINDVKDIALMWTNSSSNRIRATNMITPPVSEKWKLKIQLKLTQKTQYRDAAKLKQLKILWPSWYNGAS